MKPKWMDNPAIDGIADTLLVAVDHALKDLAAMNLHGARHWMNAISIDADLRGAPPEFAAPVKAGFDAARSSLPHAPKEVRDFEAAVGHLQRLRTYLHGGWRN